MSTARQATTRSEGKLWAWLLALAGLGQIAAVVIGRADSTLLLSGFVMLNAVPGAIKRRGFRAFREDLLALALVAIGAALVVTLRDLLGVHVERERIIQLGVAALALVLVAQLINLRKGQ